MPRRPGDDEPPTGLPLNLPPNLPPEVLRALVDGLLGGRGSAPASLFGPGGLLEREEPTLLPRRAQAVTYRVRVDLDDVRPPIWRRLEVPSDLPLDAFHDVLQAAMGWTNSHLHAFRRRLPGHVDRSEPPLLTAFDIAEGDRGTAEADVHLDEVLAEPGDRLRYTYDFGDGWDHTVKLEAVEPARADPRPRCLAGRRACPPEDCGGPWGYRSLLDLRAAQLAGRDLDEEDRERLGYYELGDPEHFSVDETDEALAAPPPSLLEEPLPRFGTQGLPPLLVPLLPRVSPDLADQLVTLGREALPHQHLGAVPEPGAVERQSAGVRWLLEQVGDDGVLLTQAGYLPPAVVAAAFEVLPLDPIWRGRAVKPRESDVVPLLVLRTALQRAGLLRKHRGRLHLTRAAQAVRHEPAALLRHLAGALPLGTGEVEQVAGLVLLLATAAGRPLHEPADLDLAVQVLHELGWAHRDGPLTTGDVVAADELTRRLLLHLGAVSGSSWPAPAGGQPPEVVAFARAALTGG